MATETSVGPKVVSSPNDFDGIFRLHIGPSANRLSKRKKCRNEEAKGCFVARIGTFAVGRLPSFSNPCWLFWFWQSHNYVGHNYKPCWLFWFWQSRPLPRRPRAISSWPIGFNGGESSSEMVETGLQSAPRPIGPNHQTRLADVGVKRHDQRNLIRKYCWKIVLF